MSGPRPPASYASYASGAMGEDYARHSRVQGSAGDHGMPLLYRALDAVVLPEGDAPFRVADLGAAAGSNSLTPMRAVVERVRGRTGRDTPVTVVHTDIPANDFNALFATVLDAPGSYAREPDVYVHAEPRSFYGRLFPAAELHLAWSAIAVQWLSRVPEPVRDHIYCARATGDARRALKERSRADWTAFLTHRARELRPGGQLVVVGGAAADDGASGAENLLDAADAVLVELVEQGLLRPAEYARMTIPTWNRTLTEFLEPLESGPLAQALRLDEHDLVALPDVILDAYDRSGDAGAFADRLTTFFQAAFGPSLFSALDPDRAPDSTAALTAAFRTRLTALLAADPRAAETHWHVVTLRMSRR
ncbi:SAM-dependent methyltransferase [Streptomyces sp. L2]|uniref:SAM-dependent methyltransferase n=1 Tax=Streptomyces sp. L2 TaxID=2162665 RepID=UPI0010106FA8|nr:SAM-dependent methyltransferase [Streptomyces sp. L2]